MFGLKEWTESVCWQATGAPAYAAPRYLSGRGRSRHRLFAQYVQVPLNVLTACEAPLSERYIARSGIALSLPAGKQRPLVNRDGGSPLRAHSLCDRPPPHPQGPRRVHGASLASATLLAPGNGGNAGRYWNRSRGGPPQR